MSEFPPVVGRNLLNGWLQCSFSPSIWEKPRWHEGCKSGLSKHPLTDESAVLEHHPKHKFRYHLLPVWPQVVLIVLLFVASLATLSWNAFSAVSREREFKIRATLRDLSERISRAATGVTDERALSRIIEGELNAFPGVEGGFFQVGEERFVAYAFPTGGPKPPRHAMTHEPPPKERPYIVFQSRQAAELEGEPVINVIDVGPSRVAIVTRAVGNLASPDLVVWAMYRLTGPDDLNAKIRRYQASLGLALLGIILSLLLMLNLGRILSRQRAEQELLRNELQRSEQLAVLGKMLAGVAHEIRNPLAGIRSTVELWQRLPETAQSETSRTAVVQAVDRLNELVSRLLYFAKAPKQDELVDVNSVVRETCDLFAAQSARQAVHFRLDLEPSLPSIRGSEGRLRQVMMNLITNALQAMPNGGTLSWGSRLLPNSNQIELTISDTGAGITQDARAHLFEPFFTTRAEGTGLGLSLCREIIQQHGGVIDLISQPGQGGAVFRICLPTNADSRRDV